MGRCETVNEKRKGIWKTVVLAVLFMSAQVLLKEDGKVFAVWWLTILVLGWCSFPLCQYLFSGFRDRGYLVAKIFGIAGAGFLMWLGARNCTVYACGLSCKHRCTGSCLLGCLDCAKETKDKGQNVLEIYNRMVPDSAG